jgi:hypothetical protein
VVVQIPPTTAYCGHADDRRRRLGCGTRLVLGQKAEVATIGKPEPQWERRQLERAGTAVVRQATSSRSVDRRRTVPRGADLRPFLTVMNPNSQAMTVTSLSATSGLGTARG